MNTRKKLKIKRASKLEITTAIDIGASKVVCLIAANMNQVNNDRHTEIIGVGQQGITISEMRQDVVSATEAAIRGAVDSAERMADVLIDKAIVTIEGRKIHPRRVGVDLDLAGGAVTQEDIFDCLKNGAAIATEDGVRPLHVVPVGFGVDGENAGTNPTGLVGSLLTVDLLGLGLSGGIDENLQAILGRCGLSVDRLVARPVASAEAVLVDDEKELGALLIDIGARSTDFAMFENGALVNCGGIGIGGDHITRDIAQIFGCSIGHAERVKAVHGSCLQDSADDHRFIDFPQLGEPGEVSKNSRAELTAVVLPRVEEILAMVRDAALKAPSPRLRGSFGIRRAVITGGGSLLPGMREVSQRVFGVKARLGRPMTISGAPDAASSPQFSACSGAIMHSHGLKAAMWHDVENDQFRLDPSQTVTSGMVAGVSKWLKANF